MAAPGAEPAAARPAASLRSGASSPWAALPVRTGARCSGSAGPAALQPLAALRSRWGNARRPAGKDPEPHDLGRADNAGVFLHPASIVAIVYAAQVGTRLQVGDIAGARRASGTARAWCIVATLLLAVFWLIALIGSVSDT